MISAQSLTMASLSATVLAIRLYVMAFSAVVLAIPISLMRNVQYTADVCSHHHVAEKGLVVTKTQARVWHLPRSPADGYCGRCQDLQGKDCEGFSAAAVQCTRCWHGSCAADTLCFCRCPLVTEATISPAPTTRQASAILPRRTTVGDRKP